MKNIIHVNRRGCKRATPEFNAALKDAAEKITKYYKQFSKCSHPPTDTKPGPRIPLRYGSAPSEICNRCGAYRSMLHGPGKWEPGPVPTEEEEEL